MHVSIACIGIHIINSWDKVRWLKGKKSAFFWKKGRYSQRSNWMPSCSLIGFFHSWSWVTHNSHNIDRYIICPSLKEATEKAKHLHGFSSPTYWWCSSVRICFSVEPPKNSNNSRARFQKVNNMYVNLLHKCDCSANYWPNAARQDWNWLVAGSCCLILTHPILNTSNYLPPLVLLLISDKTPGSSTLTDKTP